MPYGKLQEPVGVTMQIFVKSPQYEMFCVISNDTDFINNMKTVLFLQIYPKVSRW